MPELRIEVPIAVPAERAFAAMTDFANAPQRISGIKRVELLTDGPPRVGTRFRETRVMFGREATETMEVTRFDSGRSYELSAMSCGTLFRSEIRVDPAGPSSCDLTMTFLAMPQTVLAKIFALLFRGMMKSCERAMRQDMEEMKRSLESESGA